MSIEVQPNVTPAAADAGQSAVPAPPPVPAAAPAKGNAKGDAAPPLPPAVSQKQLNAAVDRLNRQVQEIRRSLRFVIDKDSGEVVVKVIDTDTQKVISQIPPSDILALREHLKQLSGILLHAHA